VSILKSDALAVPCVEPVSITETEIPGSGRRSWHLGLSAAWLVLLIGETLALSLSFDTNVPAIAGHPSAMARLIVHASALLRLAICLANPAFNAVALGLVLVSQRASLFAKADPADDRQAVESPSVAALAPLLSIVAVTMIAGAFTVGFDAYYPLRVLAAAGTLYYFRGAYAGIRHIPSWQAVAVGAATFAVWMALEPVAPPAGATSALALELAPLPKAGAMTWLAFRVVGSVITVPIAEELAFRGYLIRRLVASDFTTVRPGQFTWLSFVISSMLFGALHGRWLAGTLAGMAYALALYRRGEIVDAIVAHATTNALIAGFVLVTGSWSLWS